MEKISGKTALIFLVLTAAVLFLAGCARTPATSYYQLTPSEKGPALQFIPAGDAVIGIGPVRLREHLDQPQIVTRPGPNRVNLAADHRWAEQPAKNISWVLRENLSSLLATDRIVFYPWSRAAAVDLQLEMEILHFEGTGDDNVLLVALWQINGPEGEALARQKSTYRLPAASQDHADLAAALSEALGRLSSDVAREMTELLRN
jgi:uncharacterized protein